tara:strand:+ start:3175 stop:4158 length:984 start_codon:yes stop_codon:yes gene_type:complete
MPPLNYVNLAKLLIGGGASAFNYFNQRNQLRDQLGEAQGQLGAERARSAQAMKTLKDTQYDVTAANRRALDLGMQDPAAAAERQRQLRREASTVGALQAGGARALIGGLGAAQQQAADTTARIEADSLARKQQALQTFGALEQAARDKTIAKDLGIAEFELGRSLSRGDVAETKAADLRAQQRQFRRDGITGALTTAGSLLGSGLLQGGGTEGQEGVQNFFNQISNLFNQGGGSGSNLDMIAQMADTAANDPLVQGNNKQGGMISPGEFSHKRNPIDMVQKGNKVGELTGGEVILNPKQEKKVAMESPYFRQLLKKFKADASKRNNK